jgi:hypothetical protein
MREERFERSTRPWRGRVLNQATLLARNFEKKPKTGLDRLEPIDLVDDLRRLFGVLEALLVTDLSHTCQDISHSIRFWTPFISNLNFRVTVTTEIYKVS